jgi:hypothetical protein
MGRAELSEKNLKKCKVQRNFCSFTMENSIPVYLFAITTRLQVDQAFL